jgi:uncharacterized damage-inducible protein DinB
MKEYFKSLFEYNLYTNQQIAKAISTANSPQKALDLMGHLLTAEQVWVRRLKGEYKVDVVLWPNWPAEKFDAEITNNHQLWQDYLNSVSDDVIDGNVTYQNFQGKEFTMRVRDIITHVINHGTHTRAQIGVHLKLAGFDKLPITDFSYYKTNV